MTSTVTPTRVQLSVGLNESDYDLRLIISFCLPIHVTICTCEFCETTCLLNWFPLINNGAIKFNPVQYTCTCRPTYISRCKTVHTHVLVQIYMPTYIHS